MAICEACREQMDAAGRTKVIRHGPLTVYPARQIATWHDQEVCLSPTMAAVLGALARTGEASEEQLLVHSGRRSVKRHIYDLRRRLREAGAPPNTIISRERWGYFLNVKAGDANA